MTRIGSQGGLNVRREHCSRDGLSPTAASMRPPINYTGLLAPQNHGRRQRRAPKPHALSNLNSGVPVARSNSECVGVRALRFRVRGDPPRRRQSGSASAVPRSLGVCRPRRVCVWCVCGGGGADRDSGRGPALNIAGRRGVYRAGSQWKPAPQAPAFAGGAGGLVTPVDRGDAAAAGARDGPARRVEPAHRAGRQGMHDDIGVRRDAGTSSRVVAMISCFKN